MKHLNKILATAAVLLGLGCASAETVQNYTVDFNTPISTSDHAFKVAPGWTHIVYAGGYWGDSYVTYTYKSDGGVDGSGALYIGSQIGSTTANYDYLVTPKITGDATLQVQLTSSVNSAGVKIYALEEAEDGSELTVGEILADETVGNGTSLTEDGYGTVTVTGLNGRRIGIVGYYVNIDNFVVAGSADIEYEKALSISATSSETSGSIYCDTDNNFSFTYTITVKNVGECDLAADDPGMWVGIAQYTALDSPVATAPIGRALAIGEEATIVVTANLNYANYSSRTRFDAIEGISGNRAIVTPWIEPIPYLPNISVRDANGNNMIDYTSYATAFGAFGMINESTSKVMQVRNSGAAPGDITITVPAGFSAEPATFTIASGATTEVTVTASADQAGINSGELTLSCGDEQVFSCTLSATVLDPTKWYVDFEDGQIPAGCIVNGWTMSNGTETISDSNRYFLKSNSRTTLGKFISPLLKVTDGEKMTVDVGRQLSYDADDVLLNVYYSTDREEWVLLRTIASNELPTSKNPGYQRAYTPATFIIDGVPAGEVYIAFEAGYVTIDNIYGFELVDVAHDIMVKTAAIPANAMVNNDYTAQVTLQNILGEAEGADYTATLYFDGSAVATAEAQEIAASGTADFQFVFVPNETGEHTAYVAFTWADGYEVTTPETNVTVAEESAEAIVLVGNSDQSTWNLRQSSYAVPVCNYYNHSWSEALYTPAMLTEAGLAEGNIITSITYPGYAPASVSSDIKVYVISTDAETLAPFEKTDVTDLTPIYEGNCTFYGGSASELIDLLRIEFNEPIVWDGNALRIVVLSDNTTVYESTYFATDANLGGEIYQYRSDYTSTSSMKTSDFTKFSYFPVTKFGVLQLPFTYSGIVTDAQGVALEGVTVTLTSQTEAVDAGEGAPRHAATAGAAVYTATTDAEGKFTVEVIQGDKLYDANFTLTGYKPVTLEGIDFANGNITLDAPVVMEADEPTAVVDANVRGQIASVTYVNAAGSMSERPFEGVNIVVTRYTDGTVTTTKVVK